MNDITETIQESVEHANESKLNSKIAILVALSATIMAICNIKDGNIVQAMGQAQAHSIDAWSYFQAKSTKQSIAENSLELLKLDARKDPAIETQKKKLEDKRREMAKVVSLLNEQNQVLEQFISQQNTARTSLETIYGSGKELAVANRDENFWLLEAST